MIFVLLQFGCVLLALNHVDAALDPTEMQQRLVAGSPILGKSFLGAPWQAQLIMEYHRYVQ
jgi:hypothetical protein